MVGLLRITVEPSVSQEVRQSAAIAFKNLVKESWSPTGGIQCCKGEGRAGVAQLRCLHLGGAGICAGLLRPDAYDLVRWERGLPWEEVCGRFENPVPVYRVGELASHIPNWNVWVFQVGLRNWIKESSRGIRQACPKDLGRLSVSFHVVGWADKPQSHETIAAVWGVCGSR